MRTQKLMWFNIMKSTKSKKVSVLHYNNNNNNNNNYYYYYYYYYYCGVTKVLHLKFGFIGFTVFLNGHEVMCRVLLMIRHAMMVDKWKHF